MKHERTGTVHPERGGWGGGGGDAHRAADHHFLPSFLPSVSLDRFLNAASDGGDSSGTFEAARWSSAGNKAKETRGRISDEATRQNKERKHDRTLVPHSFVVFVSLSTAPVFLATNRKWYLGRQTTSFRRASVISCGISGLDVPPQISRPSREARGSRQAAFPIIVLNC